MNWGFIGWCASVIGTLIVVKIMWTIFRTLFSKTAIVNGINRVGEKAQEAGEDIGDRLAYRIDQKRKQKRKKQQQKKEETKPVVVVR